jgi:hypothetical protein
MLQHLMFKINFTTCKINLIIIIDVMVVVSFEKDIKLLSHNVVIIYG